VRKILYNVYIFIVIIISIVNSQTVRKNIAVLDLNPTGISENDSQFLSDRLRTELFQTGVFQVVEREKMNDILQEQGFQKSGCTTVECAVEIGQLLNVNQMVAGAIGQIEDIYSISLRLIDVETGAILKTATRDYKGKLSAVLTDVIPEVAVSLASDKQEIQTSVPIKLKQQADRSELPQLSKLSLHIKGGLVIFSYTSDINDAINKFNSEQPDYSFDKFTNHIKYTFEGRYILSERWLIKLGVDIENMLDPFNYGIKDYTSLEGHYFEKADIDQEYSLYNIYAGVNYLIWFIPSSYSFYIGGELGNAHLSINMIEDYIKEGTPYNFENSFSYNAYSWKLCTGFEYYISNSLSIGSEVSLQLGSTFDTANLVSDFEYFPIEWNDIFSPVEINAKGFHFDLILALHF